MQEELLYKSPGRLLAKAPVAAQVGSMQSSSRSRMHIVKRTYILLLYDFFIEEARVTMRWTPTVGQLGTENKLRTESSS